ELAENLKLVMPAALASQVLLQPPIPANTEIGDKDYLQMAEDLIKTGKMTVGGQEVNIKDLDDAAKKLATKYPDLEKVLGNDSLRDKIPSIDKLNKVRDAVDQSVDDNTGPIMGASFWTLIKAFFQTLGRLFTGDLEKGDGFFDSLKKTFMHEAAADTADGINEELDGRLRKLRASDPAMANLLTDENIEKLKKGVHDKAMEKADGPQPGAPAPEDPLKVLNDVKPGQVGAFIAERAYNKANVEIRESVKKDLNGFIRTSAGAADEKDKSIVSGAEEWAGFKPNDDKVNQLTELVSSAITRVVAKKDYTFEGYKGEDPDLKAATGKHLKDMTPDQQEKVIQEEVRRALKHDGEGKGLLSLNPLAFTLNDKQIEEIVAKIPAYVKDHHDQLMEFNNLVNMSDFTPPAPAPAPAGPSTLDEQHKKGLNNTLADIFDKKVKPVLEESLHGQKDDRGVSITIDPTLVKQTEDAARKAFIDHATEVIAAHPSRLKDTDALVAEVSASMLNDKALEPVLLDLARAIDPRAAQVLKAVETENDATKEATKNMVLTGARKKLTDQLADPLKNIFNEEKTHDDLVKAVGGQGVVDGDNTAPPPPPKPEAKGINFDDFKVVIQTLLLEGEPGKNNGLRATLTTGEGAMAFDALMKFDPTKPDDKKNAIIKIGEEVTDKAIRALTDKDGPFVINPGTQKLELAKDASGNPIDPQKAFETARATIVDVLKKNESENGIHDDDLRMAFATGIAQNLTNTAKGEVVITDDQLKSIK
ncbi:MAG: hypothetical protein JO089_07305, partial [Alphaproteobacteria bacterium]|nr:hypothetical protein [Alphaproteobacteria bacterium]